MIRGCALMFSFLALGEGIRLLSGLPVPGSVIGMVLLTLALGLKVVKIEWVKPVADALVSHMSFLFVPAGVGLVLYLDILSAEFLPILVSSVASTVLVLTVVGLAAKFFGGRDG